MENEREREGWRGWSYNNLRNDARLAEWLEDEGEGAGDDDDEAHLDDE